MEPSLHTLLAEWRRTRARDVAEDLDLLSDRLALEAPARAPTCWLGPATQADLPSLLAALPALDDPVLPACLDAFWRWPADPRLMTALHRLVLQQVPRSDAAWFWNRALALIAWVGDVRVADWLSEALVELQGPPLRSRHLVQRANELILTLDRRALASERPWRVGGAVRPLVPAPVELPARLVFADELLERGDPRGELIVLQSLPSPGAEHQRHAWRLIRTFGRAWLGRLSAALEPRGLGFQRGVVVAGRVTGYRALRALLGAPEWTTLEELDLSRLHRRRPPGSVLVDFLTHPTLRNLSCARGFPATELPALRAARASTGLRALHVVGWATGVMLEGLAHEPAFRRLEALTLNGEPIATTTFR